MRLTTKTTGTRLLWMLTAITAVSCVASFGQTPEVQGKDSPIRVGPTANKPSIAADKLGRPHIAVMAGGTRSPWVLHEQGPSGWRTSTLELGDHYSYADQYNNPRIEIDWATDRAWLAGIMVRIGQANGTGMGLFTWQRASERSFAQADNANQAKFFRDWVLPESAGWPTGTLSLDQTTANHCYLGVVKGWWDELAASRNNNITVAREGQTPIANGNESTGFAVSHAGLTSHRDGTQRAVGHTAITGHPAFGNGKYQNSLRAAAGIGETSWYHSPTYPDARSYTAVCGDSMEADRAYIAVNDHHHGIIMNVYNGAGMVRGITSLLTLGGSMGSPDERYQPQLAPSKDGGVFVAFVAGGAVKVQYVAPDGTTPWSTPETVGAGYWPTLCTDSENNVHVAYMSSAGTMYAKLIISSNGRAMRYPLFQASGNYDTNTVQDELAVWQAEGGWWYLRDWENSTPSTNVLVTGGRIQFGGRAFIPVPADYDNDLRTDLAVWRPKTGEWFIRRWGTNTLLGGAFSFGSPAAIPVPANYATNSAGSPGRIEPAVFYPRSGRWYIRNWDGSTPSSSVLVTGSSIQFGGQACIPVPGNYDTNTVLDELAVYYPRSGRWYIRDWVNSTASANALVTGNYIQFGGRGYIPVPADYDNDGRTDIAVWNPTTRHWAIHRWGDPNNTNMIGGSSLELGTADSMPVPGNYAANGRIEPAVYDQATGEWKIWDWSPAGTPIDITFGGPNCIPPQVYNRELETQPNYPVMWNDWAPDDYGIITVIEKD